MASRKKTLIGMGIAIGIIAVGAAVAAAGHFRAVEGPARPVAQPGLKPATPQVTAAPTAQPSATGTAIAPVRAYDHIVVIVLENQSFESVNRNPQAAYLNSLAAQNAYAKAYSGVSHPSLPNYLALTGGSTFGITSDCTGCFVAGPSVANSVEAAGLTWRAYNESMPSPCFAGDAYPYVQKHDPFYYYDSIRQSPSRCSNIVPLTALGSDFASAATTPAFSLVTPNMCNDGHDCSLATTDGWLAKFVPSLMSSPGFTTGRSLLVVTYDEGESGSDRVLTVFAGRGVKAGFTSANQYNHYSLLRTVEDSLGLATLGQADQSAVSMKEFFTAG